jgi:hypothetical protein
MPEGQKNRVSGEYAVIIRLSERTSGSLSSVFATKKDASDENGDDHTD